MTPACAATLSLSLLLYLVAALLFQGNLLLARNHWLPWGHRVLVVGVLVHSGGMVMHFLVSGHSPMSSMVVIVSLLTIGLLAAALLAERHLGARHVSLVASPVGFVALLYALLMPVRFDDAELLLVRYPWLGVHVGLSLLGYLGFALACCSAIAYLAQHRSLKHGRLNRYLPSLNAAAGVTLRFAAGGFWLFTVGLVMGVIWFFGAPGEYLRPQDTKIWMAVPTWLIFAAYLYRRSISGQHGRRLKWLVIAGFLVALANLLAVRHTFESPPDNALTSPVSAVPTAAAGRG
jgi:ABC-type transport system involved in cytochrome c biogenesis permease subunit